LIKFALIGDGAIAKYHKEAIKHVGGELLEQDIIDPKYAPTEYTRENPKNNLFTKTGFYSKLGGFLLANRLKKEGLCAWKEMLPKFDYVVIASPSHLHRQQIKAVLDTHPDIKIICEKPAFLSWEMPIDDDRINIVLQLRYLPNLPKKADLVSVRFVRGEAYFKSWKGDARKTGGLFHSLFIHYLDLAINLGADFEGVVAEHGEQERWIGAKYTEWHFWSNGVKYGYHENIDDKDKIDILNIDTQACYNQLYEAILEGKGIKPSDLFYLNWMLQRNSEIFGYGRDGIGKTITIKNELM
jgi:predicted dehydrogenase